MVGTMGSGSSEPDGCLRAIGLPPVFSGDTESYLVFKPTDGKTEALV